jgi:hypothetical protein
VPDARLLHMRPAPGGGVTGMPNRNGAKAKHFAHWSRDRWEAQVESGIRRFWARVQRSDGCWEWTGTIGTHGYGTLSFMGRSWTAPHLAYWLTHGPLPIGHEVCHTCDNQRCCRPDHLFAGTRADNIADMFAKGRQPRRDHRGIRNPSAKLTDADVAEIRRRYLAGDSLRSIAVAFNITHVYVRMIVTNKSRVA